MKVYNYVSRVRENDKGIFEANSDQPGHILIIILIKMYDK